MLERNLDALALVLPLLERAEREGLSLVCLSDRPEWLPRAAQWFHEKWHVPLAAYEESMADSLTGEAPVPRWYLVLHGEEVVAGLGVIENDFHDRPDLTPNVCAVYVEEPWRKKGIAGAMLGQVCRDMGELGVDTLYLITDHTNFYERYGWEFLCPVQGDGEDHLSRMYRHETGGSHG
ncbi:MAG: GNAT family N-acetyltransferase [Oscillospiraceae bacterium]|nr:GNAT family N-acetyltransferase [Oscillospiraceae bacterium]